MKQLLTLTLLILTLSGHAQYRIIGHITDATDRSPVIGATVTLANGIAKTNTDRLGQFILVLPTLPDTLLVSHMGYRSLRHAVSVPSQTIVIQLQASESLLEEVVVNTGYQSIPKERATGSFVHISGELLTQQVQTNVLDGLPYIANSVSTGLRDNHTAPQLRVRGMSTLNGPQDPLIILDNFPFEGDIGSINPNDVEHITILKDAAAASIWGARAGNGVIVITTKKAAYNQPLKVDVNSNLKVLPIPDLFYQPRISTSDAIELERFLFDNRFRFADTANLNRPPFSEAYELLFRHRGGELTAGALERELDRLRGIDVRRAYTDLFYDRGVNQQHALNLRSGSAKHSWYTSAAYDRNQSVLDARHQRLTLRYGNTSNLTERLSLSTGINFAWNQNRSGKTDLGAIRQRSVGLPAYTAFVDSDGTPLPFYKDYRQAYVDDQAGHAKLLDWNYYPATDYLHDRSRTDMLGGQVDVGTRYRLLTGLDAQFNYQLQFQQSDRQQDQDLESYAARDLINRFYQPNEDVYGVPIGALQERNTGRILTHNYRGQLNLDKSWNRHQLTVIAGGELRDIRRNSTTLRLYGYDAELLLSTPVNYLTQYRDFVNSLQQTVPAPEGLSAGINRYVSAYTNGSYTFDRRYTASFSARRDASNIFGANTNNKWTPLWSAGLAWNLHEEGFYDLAALPYLRLRATYGYSGNIDPSLSAITTMVYRGTSVYTLTRMGTIDRFYNPDLRREKTGQLNLAVDFRLAGSRLSGSLEWYRKNGVDLYGPSPVDYTVGIGVPIITKNAANMTARGLDLQLNSLNTMGGIRWSTLLNTSFYRDRVTDYFLYNMPLSNYVGSTMVGQVDMPVQAIRSYRWAGLDSQTGDPMGFGAEGETTADYNYLTDGAPVESLRFHGSAAPVWHGAIGNTLDWKNLSLSFNIGYRFGHYFRRPSFSLSAFTNSMDAHADYLRRWQKPGDELHTDVPSVIFPANSRRETFYRGSEVLVERADNIRLQYINLSYRFRTLQVYLNCNNLGLIWAANDQGLDPDFATTAIPNGMDIAIGLRLSH